MEIARMDKDFECLDSNVASTPSDLPPGLKRVGSEWVLVWRLLFYMERSPSHKNHV